MELWSFASVSHLAGDVPGFHGRGFFQPLTESFVQHRVHTSYRATFGSLQSFLGRIGFAVVPLVVWLFIADKPNTSATISLVWIICLIVLLLGATGCGSLGLAKANSNNSTSYEEGLFFQCKIRQALADGS